MKLFTKNIELRVEIENATKNIREIDKEISLMVKKGELNKLLLKDPQWKNYKSNGEFNLSFVTLRSILGETLNPQTGEVIPKKLEIAKQKIEELPDEIFSAPMLNWTEGMNISAFESIVGSGEYFPFHKLKVKEWATEEKYRELHKILERTKFDKKESYEPLKEFIEKVKSYVTDKKRKEKVKEEVEI